MDVFANYETEEELKVGLKYQLTLWNERNAQSKKEKYNPNTILLVRINDKYYTVSEYLELPAGGGARKPRHQTSKKASKWKTTTKTHTCKDGVTRKVYSDDKGERAVKCKVGDRFVYKRL